MENLEVDNVDTTEEETNRLKIVLDDNLDNMCEGTRIGDKAPQFMAKTTMGNMKLSDYAGSWLILFSHPGDFTPVCTTEFIAFSKMFPEFQKRNCNLLGLSIDSNSSHLAWVNNIYKTTGTQIPFPIISDSDMRIAKRYGMLAPNASSTQTVRCVFFIDPEQKIRAKLEYPMQTGRNIGEILRLLEAMQMVDNKKVLTPANWIPRFPTLMPAPSTYKDLVNRMNNQSNYNCMDWYLCFNKESKDECNKKSSDTTIEMPNMPNQNMQSMGNMNYVPSKMQYNSEYVNTDCSNDTDSIRDES